MRDLLDLEIDAAALLPPDESDHGFDNIAEVLSMSPTLLGRYLFAARRISQLAVGDPSTGPAVETFRVSRGLRQDERMSGDLPRGTRGGLAARHYFPLDGEYVVKVRLGRNFTNSQIRAIATHEEIDVLLDGVRITRFAIGGRCADAADDPACTGSGIYRTSRYQLTADEALEVRFRAPAGMRTLGVAFVKKSVLTEGPPPTLLPPRHTSSTYEAPRMDVDYVRLEGPFDPTGPGGHREPAAHFRLPAGGDHRRGGSGVRASDPDRARPEGLSPPRHRCRRRDAAGVLPCRPERRGLRARHPGGAGPAAGVAAVPVPRRARSRERPGRRHLPHQRPRAGVAAVVLSLEQHSDDELLEVAARGALREPGMIEAQVSRMLADPRASALAQSFGGQWLFVRNLAAVDPDASAYPEFDDNLREAFRRETELFLDHQIRGDRPLAELLTADHTFLNERLARFYGVRNVYGAHFRRVPLRDPRRAGLLGHASILTVTSYATRTSPVVRGKYLLDNILGAPPPPPPPDVPALEETAASGRGASVREQMEQHRRSPACASCHQRMDPLGFALENFDGIGQWRDTDGGTPIDASGVLPDGATFAGPAEFRKALLERRGEFVRTVAEKLLTYGLGRPVGVHEMPAVRRIMRGAASADYRWSSLILGIVKSQPFQMRMAQEAAAATAP